MEVEIENLKINYQEEGNGRDLLLLHGWGGRWESWYPIIKHFKESYHVVAIDLPGFGKSSMPDKAFGLSDYSRIIEKFIEVKALHKPVVIGHSFGGSVAISLASKNNDSIEKLILVDASGIRVKNLSKKFLSLAGAIGKLFFSLPLLSHYYHGFQNKFYKVLNQTDYLESGKLKETFVKIVKEDIQPLFAKISVQTLIIWGGKDKDTPLTQADIFHNNISGSKLVVIPHTGHFSYLENPEMFCEEVEKFIK